MEELNQTREQALAAERQLAEVQRERQQCEAEVQTKTAQRDRLQAELDRIRQQMGGG